MILNIPFDWLVWVSPTDFFVKINPISSESRTLWQWWNCTWNWGDS